MGRAAEDAPDGDLTLAGQLKKEMARWETVFCYVLYYANAICHRFRKREVEGEACDPIRWWQVGSRCTAA